MKNKKKINHINPNCLGAEYCEPHDEIGEVYYSSKNVIKLLSQQKRELREKIEKMIYEPQSTVWSGEKWEKDMWFESIESILTLLK